MYAETLTHVLIFPPIIIDNDIRHRYFGHDKPYYSKALMIGCRRVPSTVETPKCRRHDAPSPTPVRKDSRNLASEGWPVSRLGKSL